MDYNMDKPTSCNHEYFYHNDREMCDGWCGRCHEKKCVILEKENERLRQAIEVLTKMKEMF